MSRPAVARAAAARLVAAACAALPACTAPPVVVEPASESRGAGRPVAVPIDNFAVVADGIYRGAQPGRDGWRALTELGVKTVVNLREHHSDADSARAHGFEEIRIPLRADVFGSRAPTSEEVDAFLDLVTTRQRGPVFVHCGSGSDRTGVLFAVYRMEVDGWSRDRAIEEMEARGFHGMYKTLRRFVGDYEVKGKWRGRSDAPAGRPAAGS
jgi:protein tyrosine phosphatase (PTP) superfamily phosphohydrolase (DUF442 family)